jgi:tetratricopeptide (TPR) repeat protein
LTSHSTQLETQEIIDILGLVDHDSGSNPEKYLEEAEEIIDDLSDLRSTLLDPYDDDNPDPLSDDDQHITEDRQYAQKAFPRAAPFLVDRFVAANRRRRQRIRSLREEASKVAGGKESTAPGPAHISSVGKAVLLAPLSKPRTAASTSRVRGYRRSSAPSGSGVGFAKTAPSSTGRTSFFSHGADTHERESVTSLGSTGLTTVLEVPELQPPRPPVDTNSEKNLPFRCQYCCFEVPLELDKHTMNLEDWVRHFYLDLQPYICTFEGCNRAHKLFGVKQEWFQHELDYHRTQQTWYCAKAECRTEFETRALFEQHVRLSHPDIVVQQSAEFLDILIDTCQRLSVKDQPSPQKECPLCGAAYKGTASDWKDHIAHHLEQFALLAMGEEEDCGSSDDELDRNVLVEEFVDEVQMHVPRGRGLSAPNEHTEMGRSLVPEGSNDIGGFATDSSAALADSGGERRRRRKESEDLWEHKVETYLTKQPEEDQPDGADAIDEETTFLNLRKRNSEFVGRDNDLEHLNQYVSQSGHICVVSGRGGIGKTATAVEYAYRFEVNYLTVIWVEAETPGGLVDKYNSIGTKIFGLGLESEQDPLSFTLTVRGLLGGWDKRWLLIFDNVEAWEDISRYIPRNLPKTKGSVLITTRQQSLIKTETRALQRVLHRIELEPLTPAEGGQFLLCSIDPRVTPEEVPRHPDYGLAVQITELVERLPLALRMIAGYVKVSRATLEDFLEIWEEKTAFRSKQAQRSKLITEGALDSSIDLLWDIGISELSVPARTLLEILAVLDPENIQKDLLVGDHNEEYLDLLNSTEAALYKRMIRLLTGSKLIEVRVSEDGVESYRIHRLLQQKIQIDIAAQLKFDSAMRKATRLVRKRFPEAPAIQAPAPHNYRMCQEYMPHAFSLLRTYNDAQEHWPLFEKTKELADLFYDAGFYVWDRQATEQDGLAFLDAAEAILDALNIDQFSERRADIHCMSGLLRNTMGCQQRDESLWRLKLALNIRQHAYDTYEYSRTRDVLLQNAATDYGILLLNKYDFVGAEAIFERCLERYRAWGTEEEIPFEYSKYYYNMGIVRMWQERVDESIAFLQRSVDLAEAAFGREGQYWDNLFMLACFIRHTGDAQKALDMHLQILKARLDQFGKHSKSTILSTYAVGVMYASIGDLPTAM